MIIHEFVFDIIVKIDPEKSMFISILSNITQNIDQGEIQGTIEKINNKRVFIIETSEINDEIINIGMGFKFYSDTIKKCFKIGCDEFRSSITRNENSDKLWKKIFLNYYNVEKHKKYYSVIRPIKSIL
tara:strand:+ start:1195 stop:1578 length:384 start_codon:yes stop_codon:yes gene_type:complete